MAINSTINPTQFDELERTPKKIDIQKLKNGFAILDNLKANVNNCDCDPSNCCQTSTCQSCQKCQGCQTQCTQSQCSVSQCTCQSNQSQCRWVDTDSH